MIYIELKIQIQYKEADILKSGLRINQNNESLST